MVGAMAECRHSDKEEYMTTGEVAQFLDVSEKTVRNLHSDGKLPAMTSSKNGFRLFTRSNVEIVAAERARNPPRRVGRPKKTESKQDQPKEK